MASTNYGNMRFSHAVGYRGLFSIEQGTGEQTDKTVFLCTGGNINLTQDPIMSGGVWGAGYANAAPIAYAFNYLSLEGSANFEWVNQSKVWNAIKKFAFTERTEQTLVNLLPDGANGFHGYGWCSSVSFEASEGAALTGSMNFKGDPSDKRENEGEDGIGPNDPKYGIISNATLAFCNQTVGKVHIPRITIQSLEPIQLFQDLTTLIQIWAVRVQSSLHSVWAIMARILLGLRLFLTGTRRQQHVNQKTSMANIPTLTTSSTGRAHITQTFRF